MRTTKVHATQHIPASVLRAVLPLHLCPTHGQVYEQLAERCMPSIEQAS